jgi:hypothetical protein
MFKWDCLKTSYVRAKMSIYIVCPSERWRRATNWILVDFRNGQTCFLFFLLLSYATKYITSVEVNKIIVFVDINHCGIL